MAENHVRTVAVVGAGPVGCLAAISLAQVGWKVDLYEARPGERFRFCALRRVYSCPGSSDMRLPSSKAAAMQRSINLAISSRGIAALQSVDDAITQRFLQTTIPMQGRMIHDSKGHQHSQQYDKDKQVRRIEHPRALPFFGFVFIFIFVVCALDYRSSAYFQARF